MTRLLAVSQWNCRRVPEFLVKWVQTQQLPSWWCHYHVLLRRPLASCLKASCLILGVKLKAGVLEHLLLFSSATWIFMKCFCVEGGLKSCQPVFPLFLLLSFSLFSPHVSVWAFNQHHEETLRSVHLLTFRVALYCLSVHCLYNNPYRCLGSRCVAASGPSWWSFHSFMEFGSSDSAVGQRSALVLEHGISKLDAALRHPDERHAPSSPSPWSH